MGVLVKYLYRLVVHGSSGQVSMLVGHGSSGQVSV